MDSEILFVNIIKLSSLVRKESKIMSNWFSAMPKKYNRNTIFGDLHWGKGISSNFKSKLAHIKMGYSSFGFPFKFIQVALNSF